MADSLGGKATYSPAPAIAPPSPPSDRLSFGYGLIRVQVWQPLVLKTPPGVMVVTS